MGELYLNGGFIIKVMVYIAANLANKMKVVKQRLQLKVNNADNYINVKNVTRHCTPLPNSI